MLNVLLVLTGQIFTHLVFYIDTIDNAEKNGLTVSEPNEEVSARSVFGKYTAVDHADYLQT
jgi:hypothetical protein